MADVYMAMVVLGAICFLFTINLLYWRSENDKRRKHRIAVMAHETMARQIELMFPPPPELPAVEKKGKVTKRDGVE